MDSNNNPLSTLATLAASSQSASIDDNSSSHVAPNTQTSTSPGNANVQVQALPVGGQQLDLGQSQQTTASSASLVQLLIAQQQQQQQLQLQNLLAQQPVANQSGNLQAFTMQPPPVAATGLSLAASDPSGTGNPALQALLIQQLAQQQRTAQLQALQGLALNAVGQLQTAPAIGAPTAVAVQPQLQLHQHNPVLNSNSAPSPTNPQELPTLPPIAAVPQAAYSEESKKRKPDSSTPKKSSSKGGKKRFKSRLLAREYDLSVNSSSANTSGEWTSSSDPADGGADVGAIMNEWEDKKEAKRAANRLSAHLSRKRKKMMVEELRTEIRELRSKEMILKSIPDGVVSFDSSGTVLYANAFASGLLGRDPEGGESCALWDVVCPASAIGIKSAFMDALAKKDRGHHISGEGGGAPSKQESHSGKTESDGDSDDPVYTLVPLSDEPLRVKFASGEEMFLKGTVHFSDSAPHCVCMICPIEERSRRTFVGGRPTTIRQTEEEIKAAGKQVSSDSDVDKV
mmetsp:Transcript_19357/g.45327  ORF Transcript_19357/g.45327 Transcript_19357/m.45327 type:complete len:513 (+) Transcript_19357:94-1632(+)